MNSYRTHTCGELRSSDVNKEVKLAGWIHRKRNLGNLCFVDLRDHYGITQCVFDSSSDLFEKIEAIRPESVIGISGKVMMRESINKNIPTGDIEIKVDALENLQIAEMLVQPADADHDVFVAHLSSPLPRRFSSMWISQAKPSVATQYITEIVR